MNATVEVPMNMVRWHRVWHIVRKWDDGGLGPRWDGAYARTWCGRKSIGDRVVSQVFSAAETFCMSCYDNRRTDIWKGRP